MSAFDGIGPSPKRFPEVRQRNEEMKMKTLRVLAAGLLCIVPFASVQGAMSTFGTTAARTCYETAERNFSLRAGLTECDRALTEEVLGVRDRAATFVNRGIIRLLLKDPTGALEDYNMAISLKPGMGDAYLNRGFLYLRLGNKDEEARAELTRGIELGSSNLAAGYYGRAFANELTGRVAEAYNDFRKAAELKPDWASPKEQLTRFQVKSSD
jgi:tetratricopeptide (TPR) repeat protein